MENEIILYTDENGKTNVSVRFASELLRRYSLTQVYLQSFCSLSTLTQVFFIEISVKIW